jgi:tRNA threonylcarbamoyladenosine biosynthesis protein TsaB
MMPRPLALALDTSTPTLSCTLVRRTDRGLDVLATREVGPPAIVSTLVPGLFDELLRDAGATLDDVATMKAIAYARRIPLLGAGSLDAMALAAVRGSSLKQGDSVAFDEPFSSDWLCPIIDARKGEVYFAVCRFVEGRLEIQAPPQAAPAHPVVELLESSGRSPHAFGAGLKALGAGFEAKAPYFPGAAEIAFLALQRHRAPVFDLAQVLALEPTYVRPPEAEVARQKREFRKHLA